MRLSTSPLTLFVEWLAARTCLVYLRTCAMLSRNKVETQVYEPMYISNSFHTPAAPVEQQGRLGHAVGSNPIEYFPLENPGSPPGFSRVPPANGVVADWYRQPDTKRHHSEADLGRCVARAWYCREVKLPQPRRGLRHAPDSPPAPTGHLRALTPPGEKRKTPCFHDSLS